MCAVKHGSKVVLARVLLVIIRRFSHGCGEAARITRVRAWPQRVLNPEFDRTTRPRHYAAVRNDTIGPLDGGHPDERSVLAPCECARERSGVASCFSIARDRGGRRLI